jgi:hypothetical protein
MGVLLNALASELVHNNVADISVLEITLVAALRTLQLSDRLAIMPQFATGLFLHLVKLFHEFITLTLGYTTTGPHAAGASHLKRKIWEPLPRKGLLTKECLPK